MEIPLKFVIDFYSIQLSKVNSLSLSAISNIYIYIYIYTSQYCKRCRQYLSLYIHVDVAYPLKKKLQLLKQTESPLLQDKSIKPLQDSDFFPTVTPNPEPLTPKP